MKRAADRNATRIATRVGIAIVLVLLVIAYVFLYAALGGGGRTFQQISSLVVFALYLSVLLLVVKQRLNGLLVGIYLFCSIASGLGFSFIWQFDIAKSVIVGVCLFVLAITSRWWLKSM